MQHQPADHPESQTARPLPQPVFYRVREVTAYLNLSRASIYSLMNKDPTFPKSINLTGKAVAWYRTEIEDWALNRRRRQARAAANVREDAEGDRAN